MNSDDFSNSRSEALNKCNFFAHTHAQWTEWTDNQASAVINQLWSCDRAYLKTQKQPDLILRCLLSDSEVCTQINTNRKGSCLYVTWSTQNFLCADYFDHKSLWKVLHKKTCLTLWVLSRFTVAVFKDELCSYRQDDSASGEINFESECRTVIGCM